MPRELNMDVPVEKEERAVLTPEAASDMDEDFYEIVDNLPTLCWVAHADGSIFWYNRRWYSYTGTTAASQLGWGWTEVHHPQNLPEVLERWRYSIATGEPFEMTFPLRGSDGIFRPFLTRVVPLRSASGEIKRWLGTNVDVSAQMAAEESLHASEALYRTAMAAGRLGAWQTDLVARTRLWTKESMTLFGLDLPGGRGRVGGDTDEYHLALHPDDRHLMQKFHKLADVQDAFTSEYRVVRPNGTTLWLRGHGQVVARTPEGRAHRMVSIVADVTETKAAEDHIRFLLHEISHRSKNLITVIQSIARRTARTSSALDDFSHRFEQRLLGLAASHDVLVRSDWHGAQLADLVRQHLAPFIDVQSTRLVIQGTPLLVKAEAAQAIGLALHELATNASKYGALSTSAGTVVVSWDINRSRPTPTLSLRWVENAGPPVAAPMRKGFGRVVMEEMVGRALGGEVVTEFFREGLRWSASIPLENVVGEHFGASHFESPVSGS